MNKELEQLLESKQVKPTAMRLLVLEFLLGCSAAVSLQDLETEFHYSDRTTLYRTLKTFEEKLLIHSINDGTGSIKYALCDDDCIGNAHTDLHLHFNCTVCANTVCLPKTKVPRIVVPDGYKVEQVDLVAKVSKYFALTYFMSYMLIAFVWPSVRTYRSTGINPITFGGTNNAHDFIGTLFKAVLALIPIVIVINLVDDRTYGLLLPVWYLEKAFLQLAGMILCVISFLWTVVAQLQMGNSWRIGIDEKNKTTLVTTGLFSVSRNPIFFGMIVTLVGLFLLLPNAITLLVMTAGYMLIQIQTRLEEEFLLRQHGQSYLDYRSSVRRYI
jgi:protein-S-isoprenylcysteine O-methyltransferase Ste14/Fe2+ or Zn2+ uptake regulation protein